LAHFNVSYHEDGTIRDILRDGAPYEKTLVLEQLFSIPRIYFELACENLDSMSEQKTKREMRGFGLQSYLMATTGLEAFVNTYFHLRATELESAALLSRIEQKHGSLSKKIKELIDLTGDGLLIDQEQLLARVHDVSLLRNEIVHPRWEPAAVTLSSAAPIVIKGLVQNFQSAFEDVQFCREAVLWCLLVVARVAQSRGHSDVSGFMFHWTGRYGLGLAHILEALGLES
jgi:hypothetical protein